MIWWSSSLYIRSRSDHLKGALVSRHNFWGYVSVFLHLWNMVLVLIWVLTVSMKRNPTLSVLTPAISQRSLILRRHIW